MVTCKCGINYCRKHISSFLHECTYDYKKEAKEILEKNNKKICASKLDKIN